MDSLEEAGFNKFFIRPLNIPANEDITGYEFNSRLQDVSASKVQGGKMISQDGKLVIDLDNGTISYNDGIEELFSLGDSSLTVQDSNGNTILTT